MLKLFCLGLGSGGCHDVDDDDTGPSFHCRVAPPPSNNESAGFLAFCSQALEHEWTNNRAGHGRASSTKKEFRSIDGRRMRGYPFTARLCSAEVIFSASSKLRKDGKASQDEQTENNFVRRSASNFSRHAFAKKFRSALWNWTPLTSCRGPRLAGWLATRAFSPFISLPAGRQDLRPTSKQGFPGEVFWRIPHGLHSTFPQTTWPVKVFDSELNRGPRSSDRSSLDPRSSHSPTPSSIQSAEAVRRRRIEVLLPPPDYLGPSFVEKVRIESHHSIIQKLEREREREKEERRKVERGEERGRKMLNLPFSLPPSVHGRARGLRRPWRAPRRRSSP